MDLKHRLAGVLVAASIAGSGTAALASSDDLQADIDGSDAGAVARAHGTAISALARATESGPGKGAIVSAAASAQASGRPADAGAKGAAVAAAAKADGKALGQTTAAAAKAKSR